MIVTCCTIFVGRKVIVTNNLTCVKILEGVSYPVSRLIAGLIQSLW